MWCVSIMCTQIPTDVLRLIRSFANEHHVLTNREAFFTAVQTLRKVTMFITVRFRTAHMGYLLLGILRLLRLGAMVPKDGVVYHNYRRVRKEIEFGVKHFVWRPSNMWVVAKVWSSGSKFPYI